MRCVSISQRIRFLTKQHRPSSSCADVPPERICNHDLDALDFDAICDEEEDQRSAVSENPMKGLPVSCPEKLDDRMEEDYCEPKLAYCRICWYGPQPKTDVLEHLRGHLPDECVGASHVDYVDTPLNSGTKQGEYSCERRVMRGMSCAKSSWT